MGEVEITEVQRKGSHLNTIEIFQIYNKKLTGIIIFNENLHESYNPILEVCR
jgi:hypothetical protein